MGFRINAPLQGPATPGWCPACGHANPAPEDERGGECWFCGEHAVTTAEYRERAVSSYGRHEQRLDAAGGSMSLYAFLAEVSR